jgi:hypothetical protein
LALAAAAAGRARLQRQQGAQHPIGLGLQAAAGVAARNEGALVECDVRQATTICKPQSI